VRGLVTKSVHGRERRVRGRVDALRAAARQLDQLERLWHDRLDRIDDLLADDPATPEGDPDLPDPAPPDREAHP
jgi:hypothetical protein